MHATAQKPREAWVDVARCLAMAVIMCLHAGANPVLLGAPVGGAIALFFVLSGYFMPQEAGAAAVRALRLGLAWLLWSGISLALYIAAQPGVEWSWAGALGIGRAAYNVPLWFLKDLCLYQLIIAGLAALRLLPRYKWLLLVALACCTYAAEPAQHETLRFDNLPAVLLGYALRGISLTTLRHALARHALPLLIVGMLLLLQRAYYPRLLLPELRAAASSLPVEAGVWAVWYALAGVAIVYLLPRASAIIARAGACMLFIYAAHSLAYAPFYVMKLPTPASIATMLALLPLLYAAHAALARLFPRLTRLLTAKAP